MFPHLIVHDGPFPHPLPPPSPSSVKSTFQPTGRRKDRQDTSAPIPLANLVTWQHSVVRRAGKCSLYFGQHVPRVLFFKKKRIVLRENWQSATIAYHMRITVWFIFPQQETADISSAISCPFFFFLLHFSQQKRIIMHSERCEVSRDQVAYSGGMSRYNLSN